MKARTNKQAKLNKKITSIIAQIFLALLALIVVFPIVYVVLISFGKNVVSGDAAFPTAFTLDNYKQLFTQTRFAYWMGNTMLIAGSTVVISLIFVSVSVYVFSRLRFKGKQSLFNTVLLLQVFPLTLSMVSLFKIFAAIGLLNKPLSLIIVDSALCSASLVLVAKGYFDTIPYELDEAARIDGASRLGVLVRIILPLALPMLSFIAIQSFVLSYNEYVIASAIMSEGVDAYPVAVGLQSILAGQQGQNWSLYCAGAVLGSIPMLILFYSLQKYFIGGLTSGGVKG